MEVRSLVGSLQLPVAIGGACLVALSIGRLVTLLPSPPESEGFVRGLAALVLYGLTWAGFVAFALGLAIPPSGGYGIAFNRYQRGLFVAGAAAGVASAVAPFVAFGLLLSTPGLVVPALLGLLLVAALSVAAGLAWRAAEAVGSRPASDSTRRP